MTILIEKEFNNLGDKPIENCEFDVVTLQLFCRFVQ